MSLTILTIVYTIDMILSVYQPFIPWLALRQNNSSPLRVGQSLNFEFVHRSPSQRAVSGRIRGISHFCQGFVIVIVAMDPKAFASAVYVAIPRSWIVLTPLSSLIYRLSYHSLPVPRFTHFLDPSHTIHQSDCLQNSPEGSRHARRST
jgi:hypothetical protein